MTALGGSRLRTYRPTSGQVYFWFCAALILAIAMLTLFGYVEATRALYLLAVLLLLAIPGLLLYTEIEIDLDSNVVTQVLGRKPLRSVLRVPVSDIAAIQIVRGQAGLWGARKIYSLQLLFGSGRRIAVGTFDAANDVRTAADDLSAFVGIQVTELEFE